MRNFRTREGYRWWDIFNKLPRYSFMKVDDSIRACVTPFGDYSSFYQISELIDEMEMEINKLNDLVYCYPPSEPFAPDGSTWKQEYLELSKKYARLRGAELSIIKTSTPEPLKE